MAKMMVKRLRSLLAKVKPLKKAYRFGLGKYVAHTLKKDGFWFVDIPRTSSSSIRSELGNHFGWIHGKMGIIEKEYRTRQFGFVSGHRTAQEMRDMIGPSTWNKIFTFSFIRNPWDRTYSMYHFRIRRKHIAQEQFPTFKSYVLELVNNREKYLTYRGTLYSICDYLLDENGAIMVDFVGRYENREEDIKYIGSRLKIKDFGNVKAQSASPKNKSYQEAYDEETKEIIQKLYAKDIELFGYKFGD